jgi:hypothetical protein
MKKGMGKEKATRRKLTVDGWPKTLKAMRVFGELKLDEGSL